MVIDRNETVAPLFWYLYRPMVVSRRDDNHAAGGFNVALYPDNTLVFCKFDGLNRMVDRCTFQLGPEVIGEYMTILESQSWWMGKLPREIRTDGRASYTCMFGFTRSHPLFACEDINTLVLAPFNSQRGMYARRLRNMLECMAEMSFDYGIEQLAVGYDQPAGVDAGHTCAGCPAKLGWSEWPVLQRNAVPPGWRQLLRAAGAHCSVKIVT